MKIKFDSVLIGFKDKLTTNDPILDREYTEAEIGQAFGYTLKKLRDYNDLSLKALSKEIDIPAQTIHRYENGVNIPTITQAVKIADYFYLSIELFILMGLVGIYENGDIIPHYRKLKEAIILARTKKGS